MRILVACEYSGIIRDAFAIMGHEAWSCDLIPSESSGNHYEGDIRDIIYDKWDLIIAHPPCTHLSVSGAKWFKEKRKDGRQQSAIDFFMMFTKLNCDRVCIENPIGIMSTVYRKPNQTIQPWMYGHPEFKATCLWLKRLPRLNGKGILIPPGKDDERWNSWNIIHRLPPSEDRGKLRSLFYPLIAKAMAEQWDYLLK